MNLKNAQFVLIGENHNTSSRQAALAFCNTISSRTTLAQGFWWCWMGSDSRELGMGLIGSQEQQLLHNTVTTAEM
jgi:hypothetical protein